jgi:hypothetical protein
MGAHAIVTSNRRLVVAGGDHGDGCGLYREHLKG